MAQRATAKPIAQTNQAQSWQQRGLWGLLLLISIMLIVLDQRGNAQVNNLRARLADAVVPAVQLLSQPIETVKGAGAWVEGIFHAHSENALLRAENARLKQWMISASQLQAQNASLQALLNVPAPEAPSFVTTQAVADLRGPYAQAMLIGAGKEQHVALHQPVVGPEGLVGRVVELQENSARILLVTDINSRIPVMGNRSGKRAVLAGKGSKHPQLLFAEGKELFAEGEWLVTIATETIPAGIPVAAIVEPNDAEVVLLQKDTALDYLRVIQYSPIAQ